MTTIRRQDQIELSTEPSAGGLVRKSIIGAPPGREYLQTNGWILRRLRDADGRLAAPDVLRQRQSKR